MELFARFKMGKLGINEVFSNRAYLVI